MKNLRFDALQKASSRTPIVIKLPSHKISDYFAENVFTPPIMQQYMPKDAFKRLMVCIEKGEKIEREIADYVASAMKSWAISQGANSFTHWFQPLTGATAEKHDTFFTLIDSTRGIESFSGDRLVQQEPDGSSFPSGGLRATFEARGYTAWDPSSPAFIVSVGEGKTLCIPTIFISYTGESLDYKAPLLKSQAFLEKAAVDVCHYFDKSVARVTPTLGWEQEYFLVDAALYNARPDLVATGRTLVGASAAKGQQLEDHYFASIPERVYAYMLDFEAEAHKLGITISTRHNEVAPGQYECAPVYSEANIAVDHNQLLMDIMERVAKRHHLRVLFHEKPFAGVNGSGKHNNWSMATDTGINLLSPGKTPKTNIQFLTFFINTIKALSMYADLLRASIASAGNDHRLGANEAPPAIISAFIGTTLTQVLEEVEGRVKDSGIDEYDRADLKIDIHNKIPDVLLDNTDRNRTSPFAFTGNKFEVRAVGSSANCAATMTVLNTIVAQQLTDFKTEVDALIAKGEKKDTAIWIILRKYIAESKHILFEGDNYSAAWEEEAARRGLSNIKDTPRALQLLMSENTKRVFTQNGIFTERELRARYEVLQENYAKKIDIEIQVLKQMVITQVIPAAVAYQNQLLNSLKTAIAVNMPATATATQRQYAEQIGEHLNALAKHVEALQSASDKAHQHKEVEDVSAALCDHALPIVEAIRTHVDSLELLVDDQLWPFPKYRELLFIR